MRLRDRFYAIRNTSVARSSLHSSTGLLWRWEVPLDREQFGAKVAGHARTRRSACVAARREVLSRR